MQHGVRALIGFYASGTATADSIATAIIPLSGRIVCVEWVARGTTAAGGGSNEFQLSLQSTGQFTTNDVRNVLSNFIAASSVASLEQGFNTQTMFPGVQIAAGDRLYIHRLQLVAWTVMAINVNVCVA